MAAVASPLFLPLLILAKLNIYAMELGTQVNPYTFKKPILPNSFMTSERYSTSCLFSSATVASALLEASCAAFQASHSAFFATHGTLLYSLSSISRSTVGLIANLHGLENDAIDLFPTKVRKT